MSKLVVNGAKLRCSEGLSPSTLTILPVGPASADSRPAATVMDDKPMANIAPFGMCQTQATRRSPPRRRQRWACSRRCRAFPSSRRPRLQARAWPRSTTQKALTDDSKCTCAWTGSIEITDAGSEIDVE